MICVECGKKIVASKGSIHISTGPEKKIYHPECFGAPHKIVTKDSITFQT